MPFMTIDMLGGVFNDLSLAFKDKFIVLASITYTLVVVSMRTLARWTCCSRCLGQVMDLVVIVLAFILNPRARRRRKREALAVMEDDVASAEIGITAAGGSDEFGMTERAGPVSVGQPENDFDEKQGVVSDDGEKGDSMVMTSDCQL